GGGDVEGGAVCADQARGREVQGVGRAGQVDAETVEADHAVDGGEHGRAGKLRAAGAAAEGNADLGGVVAAYAQARGVLDFHARLGGEHVAGRGARRLLDHGQLRGRADLHRTAAAGAAAVTGAAVKPDQNASQCKCSN